MATITSFEYFNIKFDQIVPPIVFFVGVIGNIFNIIIFNRRRFRNNPCTTYFFALTITSLNNFFFGTLPGYLGDTHGIDIVTNSIAFCRIRFMILNSSAALSAWLIVLAGVDRFCLSSRDANRRRFSTLKNARISVGVATLISIIIFANILFFTLFKTLHPARFALLNPVYIVCFMVFYSLLLIVSHHLF